MYLVSEYELEDFKKGKVSFEELTKPEKRPIITWSGEDIKLMLERKGILEKIDLDEVVEKVKKGVENCDCSMCIECAFDYIVDEVMADSKEE